jgi:hypothetical protein
MEFVREIRRVNEREFKIKLPDSFKYTDVEVLILPLNKDSVSTDRGKVKKRKVEKDIIEALTEVKMMRDGSLPEKGARELLNEL